MITAHIDLGPQSYDIHIKPGLLNESGAYFTNIIPGTKTAIVTDDNVGALYGTILSNELREAGYDVIYCSIEPGETSKKIENVTRLCRQFSQGGLDRNSAVIALGGGVAGDVAGFAAAIYMRGIHYVQMPTTLLADCDSAVGGKVGVNLDSAKNMLGSFYQPRAVLIDPELLTTLPLRELKAGLAEVIKTGLIGDPELYRLIFTHIDEIVTLSDIELICTLIHKSVLVKASVVSKDEKEAGLRRILNFGHTIGHAIEGVFGGENILHGEAVLLGMRAASWISHEKGMLTDREYRELDENLSRVSVPVDIGSISPHKVLKFIKKDKKRVDSRLNFILLETIGKPYVTNAVGDNELREALEFIQGH